MVRMTRFAAQRPARPAVRPAHARPERPAVRRSIPAAGTPSGPPPLRVLMTTDCVGGVWTYALQLIEAMDGSAEFLLATMGRPPSPGQRADAEALANLTLAESEYKLEWQADPWADVDAAGRWLLDLAEDFRPDLVHLNNFCHGDLDWHAPALIVGHSDVLSWHRACRFCRAGQDWREYERRVRRGLRAADAVVAPTDAMRRGLVGDFGPLSRTHVLPNARCGRRFRPGRKEPFVFSAGRLWDAGKNVEALAAAAEGLAWPVRVAGDDRGPDGRAVRPANVEMLGALDQDDMARQFAAASIYCLPARYEPFGLSALEAALSGCALVLGDIPTLREVWADAAEFVPTEDSAALHRALRRLIRDEPRRRHLADAARARAARFTPAHQRAMYLGVYNELARPETVRGQAAPDRVSARRRAVDELLTRRN